MSGRYLRPARVVAIGASAGGLEALERLFAHLAPRTGLAIVVMQHRTPADPKLLPDLIQSYTRTRVLEAVHGAVLDRDRVYVVPAACRFDLARGVVHISAPGADASHTPIDDLFRSLARDAGRRAIAIVLAGAGADGSSGVKAVKAAGGCVFVQEPATATYDSMPRNALGTGCVDLVATPEKLGDLLSNLPRKGPPRAVIAGRRDPDERAILVILGLVRTHTNQDFARYKPTTVRRRILRRMAVLGVATLPEYEQRLAREPAEAGNLAAGLVIGVTRFFRDPAVWEALAVRVLPRLLAVPTQTPARIWVAGCSTGEEAYTFAIVIRRQLERVGSARPIQIFASDLDLQAVARARRGLYPASIAQQLDRETLEQCFVRTAGQYRIADDLRRMVMFAQHDLLEDPPFARLDLISCRNVLIYMDLGLQRKLLDLFHYALLPAGVLVLGTAESPAPRNAAFEPHEPAHRIFMRSASTTRHDTIRTLMTRRIGRERPVAPAAPRGSMKIIELARTLLNEIGAASAALVDEQDALVFLHGDLAGFLEPVERSASLALREMLPPQLVQPLATAMASTRESGCEAQTEWIPAPDGSGRQRVKIQPVLRPAALAGLLMLTFEKSGPVPGPIAGTLAAPVEPAPLELERLRRELAAAQSLLAGSGEHVRRARDEALESRQDLQTASEELQSTNEELETTKEELLAVNQEIEALNADLKRKVTQLAPSQADLENLLLDRRSSMLCMDADLRLLRYSRGIEELIRVRPEDLGRVVGEITLTPLETTLATMARRALRSLAVQERAVQGPDGRWFELRVVPTRERLDLKGEVLVTFADISSKRNAAADWRGAERACELLPVWMSDVLTATDAEQALREACRALVDGAAYRGAWAARCGSGPKRRSARISRTGRWQGCAPDAAPPRVGVGVEHGLVTRLMKAGHALVVRDPGRAGSRARTETPPGAGATALLALRNGERLIGVLAVRAAGADSFGATELRLLAPLADSLGRRLGELAFSPASESAVTKRRR